MASTKSRTRLIPPATKTELARSLLAPIAKFLAASGVDERTAKSILTAEWADAATADLRVKITALSATQALSEIVANWTKYPDYLDDEGNPRVLPISGKRSFASLVASVDSHLDYADVADQLRKYGNVRRLPGNRIKLLKKFLHVGTSTTLAFEPSLRFLADASSTINSIISKVQLDGSPTVQFWRIAERRNLPASEVDPFLEFLRARSLVHLKEVDDWLQARAPNGKKKEKGIRAGAGFFSICSTNDEM
jgi:hypothetical protein